MFCSTCGLLANAGELHVATFLLGQFIAAGLKVLLKGAGDLCGNESEVKPHHTHCDSMMPSWLLNMQQDRWDGTEACSFTKTSLASVCKLDTVKLYSQNWLNHLPQSTCHPMVIDLSIAINELPTLELGYWFLPSLPLLLSHMLVCIMHKRACTWKEHCLHLGPARHSFL